MKIGVFVRVQPPDRHAGVARQDVVITIAGPRA